MPAANRGPWGSLATIAFTVVIACAFLLVQGALAIPYVLLTVKGPSPKAIEAAAQSLESDGLFLGVSEVCSGATALALTLRGFLFEGLRRSWLGDAGTVLLTALMFASIHVQYVDFYVAQVFCLGLLLGAARVRTGSVILTVGMHALVNAVAMLQLALEVR